MEDQIKRKQRKLRWRDRHPEYGREYSKRWRAKNPDYGREYSKRWRAIPGNRERMREKSRRYTADNREEMRVARALAISVAAARDLLRAMEGKRPDEMISLCIDKGLEFNA